MTFKVFLTKIPFYKTSIITKKAKYQCLSIGTKKTGNNKTSMHPTAPIQLLQNIFVLIWKKVEQNRKKEKRGVGGLNL